MVLFSGCSQKQSQTDNDTQSTTVKEIQTSIIHLTELPVTNDTLQKSTPEEYFKEQESETGERLIVHSALSDTMIFAPCPFLNSARLAYAQHRPLVISPDVVWLVIESGFAKHVEVNSEKIRHCFVSFKGKKTLKIYTEPGLLNKPAEEWEPLFPQFTKEISKWTSRKLVQTFRADFSTTTPTAAVASDIMLMSAMQSYFDYCVDELCGIPDIYLEGTADDWNNLIEKANTLRNYGLNWWMDELEPVLKKIAAAADGERDIAFWQSIIRKKDLPVEGEEMCGWTPAHEEINGWIAKFYPYNQHDKREKLDIMYDSDISDLLGETGSAPLRYEDALGGSYNLAIHAGVIGIEEDTTTRALRPVIAWWVCWTDKD